MRSIVSTGLVFCTAGFVCGCAIVPDLPEEYTMPVQDRAFCGAVHPCYAHMQAKLLELEKALAEFSARPGMGHNLPPEPLEIESIDINELTHAIQALKEQPESPPDKGEAALKAITSIESKASKLRGWAERRDEEFAIWFEWPPPCMDERQSFDRPGRPPASAGARPGSSRTGSRLA